VAIKSNTTKFIPFEWLNWKNGTNAMIEGRSYSLLAANPSTCFRQFLFLDAEKVRKGV